MVDRVSWRERLGASPWGVMPEARLSPAMNAALDEVLLDECVAGRRGAALRFWGWDSKAVILGRHQSVRNEVRAELAFEDGVTLSRRMTGGGAMYTEPDRVITYSMYLPESAVAGMSIVDSFAFCDAWAVEALRRVGVEADYKPINDIVSPVGKIGGAAQFRRDGWVLHHTMIAYSIDLDAMVRVLRIGEAKLSDKGIRSAAKRVSPLAALSGRTREEIRDAMGRLFREALAATDDAPRGVELERARELTRTKYMDDEWIHKIP